MQIAFINLESSLPGILPSVAVNSDMFMVLRQEVRGQEPLIAEISYFRRIRFMCILDFQFLKILGQKI